MKHLLNVIALSILMTVSGSAQFSAGSNLSQMYDDNINNNAEQTVDNITSLAGTVRYDWEGESWEAGVNYGGSVNYFQRTISRTNQFHDVGGEYLLYAGDENRNILRLAASLGNGIFRDDFVFYNHDVFTASLDYKRFVSASLINTWGYTFRSYSFGSSSWFSYSEHLLYGHLAVALSPQTTVITQVDVGSKSYSESDGASGGNKGWISSISPDVAQVTGLVRIGQRITDNIGLSAAVRYQWNALKQSRYLVDDEGYLISDDEIFDDHYGYEGLQSTLTWSQILSETMMLRATGGYTNKIYSQLPAFDRTGFQTADQRTDGRFYLHLQWEKEFAGLGFSLKSSLDLITQSSNDPYYDYDNKAVSVEILFPF